MVMEEASDPDESKLLLRALRDFAEDCRVPELNSACPYYEIAADSLPTCAEQCMDILGKHGAPPPTEVIEFEGGISLRRTKAPRPRRSVSSAKPYDAGEVYLSESSRPMAEWSTTTVGVGEGGRGAGRCVAGVCGQPLGRRQCAAGSDRRPCDLACGWCRRGAAGGRRPDRWGPPAPGWVLLPSSAARRAPRGGLRWCLCFTKKK